MIQQVSDQEIFQKALSELQATASTFAHMCIKDSNVRAQYLNDISATASEFENSILTGRLTARDAAEQVNNLRNQIMELSRTRSSPVGRAYAMRLKSQGRTMGELTEKYARKLFQKAFKTLSENEQAAVYKEIVSASGRADPAVVVLAESLGKVGRRLFFASLAIAVYEIYEAEDKPREVARQGVIAGAGVAGGWAVGAGAVATGVCAATAPVCIGVAAFIGGMVFAFGADLNFGTVYPTPARR